MNEVNDLIVLIGVLLFLLIGLITVIEMTDDYDEPDDNDYVDCETYKVSLKYRRNSDWVEIECIYSEDDQAFISSSHLISLSHIKQHHYYRIDKVNT